MSLKGYSAGSGEKENHTVLSIPTEVAAATTATMQTNIMMDNSRSKQNKTLKKTTSTEDSEINLYLKSTEIAPDQESIHYMDNFQTLNIGLINFKDHAETVFHLPVQEYFSPQSVATHHSPQQTTRTTQDSPAEGFYVNENGDYYQQGCKMTIEQYTLYMQAYIENNVEYIKEVQK